jgi:hypothetical protein
VLFRQKRHGFNNELIEIFKFRSMYVDRCDAHAANLVTKGDARVTAVGRFIRKTSLDELPQLLTSSPARSRSSDRARTRCKPRPPAGFITPSSTATSAATR